MYTHAHAYCQYRCVSLTKALPKEACRRGLTVFYLLMISLDRCCCRTWFLQETGFVTATQRVLDEPLAIRFHYGHPDVFDKVHKFFLHRVNSGLNVGKEAVTCATAKAHQRAKLIHV